MRGIDERLEVSESTSPVIPEVRFIGFTLAGVNKGSAMQTIAAALGVDLQDVMYVGDSGNRSGTLANNRPPGRDGKCGCCRSEHRPSHCR